MPNIMLTYRCNLQCPYCFANEFVNREKTDITIRDFLKAVSFITKTESILGIIGGEPTLHPGFGTIMDLLIANPRVKGIRLFTNGLLLHRYIPQVTHPKVETCVNCNSPQNTGETAYASLKQNLDLMFQQENMQGRVLLGFNLYDDDMDCSYIVELLQRYKQHRARISVTAPDLSSCSEPDAMEYFRKRKKFLMEFYKKMDSIGVLPSSDCNHPPYCIWTDEEKEWLEAYAARYPGIRTNIADPYSRCYPVVDILPNLHAVRCFGMSDFMKVPIDGFRNFRDIVNYFIYEIDSVAYKLPACEDCKACDEWKARHCLGGCIAYKASKIRSCNEMIMQI